MSELLSRFDVRGRTAIVTGGSRGLGRSIVLGFAEAGMNVVVASRNLKACQAAGEEARLYGVQALAVEADVASWQDCERLVGAAWESFGSVDVLVNNAGKAPTSLTMEDITESLIERTIGVNFRGPLRLSCLAGARMARQGRGSIVNIGSVAATRPNPQAAVYGAAKAALMSLTMPLAIEYGPSVRVNAISLGAVRTDASAAWIESARFRDAARMGIALQRGAEADEVVGTVLYLASDGSSFTTGAVLDVDGGIFGDVLSATRA